MLPKILSARPAGWGHARHAVGPGMWWGRGRRYAVGPGAQVTAVGPGLQIYIYIYIGWPPEPPWATAVAVVGLGGEGRGGVAKLGWGYIKLSTKPKILNKYQTYQTNTFIYERNAVKQNRDRRRLWLGEDNGLKPQFVLSNMIIHLICNMDIIN